jgi:hypothetical protein
MTYDGTHVLGSGFTGDQVDSTFIVFADRATKNDPISLHNRIAFMVIGSRAE